jgi:uncharacterized membrane protein
MNKNEFMNSLKSELAGYNQAQIDELCADYEEHFVIGAEEKRTESEIAEKLGDPKMIAREYKTAALVKVAEAKPTPVNIGKALFAFVGLGFFNLVFIFGPFMGAIGLVFGGIVTAIALVFSGIVGVFASVLAPFIDSINVGMHPVGAFFLSLSLACFGALLAIAMYYMTKLFLSLTLKYLKFNLSVVTGEK